MASDRFDPSRASEAADWNRGTKLGKSAAIRVEAHPALPCWQSQSTQIPDDPNRQKPHRVPNTCRPRLAGVPIHIAGHTSRKPERNTNPDAWFWKQERTARCLFTTGLEVVQPVISGPPTPTDRIRRPNDGKPGRQDPVESESDETRDLGDPCSATGLSVASPNR